MGEPAVRGRPAPWRDPVVAALVALLLLAGVQALVLDDPARTLRAAAPFALALAGYLAVLRVPARTTLRWLGGPQLALAVAALAAFGRALPSGFDDPSGFYRVKVLVTTAAGDHNTVGGLLLVGVVVTAVLGVEDRRWWLGTLVTTLGIVATLSRGAAVVLLAAGLGALVVRARREVAVVVLTAGVASTLAVTTLAAVLGAAPPGSAGPSVGIVGASLTGRLDLIVRGLETALAQLGLGVGLGRFVETATDLPFPNLHAHNAVAHLGAEAGIVGAMVAVVLAVTLAVRAWRSPAGSVRDVALVGGAALVAHAQVDVLAGVWSYELLLAVLVAMVAGNRPSPAASATDAGARIVGR